MPSYQVNSALTQAHYGGGEFAEILEVASEINPDDRESFNKAWVKMGDKVYDKAEQYAQAGIMFLQEELISGLSTIYAPANFL